MKTITRMTLYLLSALLFASLAVFPLIGAVDEGQLSTLMDKESNFEREKAEYLQTSVLDKILGLGKAIVIIDVQMGIETKIVIQEAKEKKSEKKRRLGEVDYLLPGVPNPKSVSQESSPGESKEESGQAAETKTQILTVIKKIIVTVLYDEKVSKERLDIVKDAIMSSMKIDLKRGDKIDFKKTKFTQGFMDELLKPLVLIPLLLALLLLVFLFGPLSSILRSFVRTLSEKGGTEVTVDSKFDGGPGNEDGKGGAGALTTGELEALEREKKKYHPFDYINDENLKRMVYLIRREPPQSVALVVSYLKPEYVREVLNALTPEMQAKVALEMATIRSMDENQVKMIDDHIKEKIEFLIGGISHLLEVIDQVDKVTQNNIFEYLRDEQPELYEKVRKFVIMWEDIPNFPDQAMQVIIRELKTQDMAKALRNSDTEVLNKFFANMSANAAAILKEEMEYGRPITEPEIEEERKKMINLIKQLEKDSRIFIREKPKSDMLEGIDNESQQGEEQDGGAGYEEYFNAGVQTYEAGQYEEAVSYFEYCLQLDPSNSGLYQYLGNSYYGLGRMQEAVASYEKALELNPEDQGLRTWLAEQKNVIS